MKTTVAYIFILVLFMAAGCRKKEYPVPVNNTGEITFYTKLLVNGQALEINTGKEYYMYSSYELDYSNVYKLVGEFKQPGCTGNCPNSISFQIYDSKTSSPNDAINIDNVLQARNYDFWRGDSSNTVGYSLHFTGTSNKPGSTFLWHFDDGGTSTSESPLHTFILPGLHQVALTVTAPDMSQSSVVNSIILNTANDLNAYVTTAPSGTNALLFTSHVTGGVPPYTYLWTFGDRFTATGDTVLHHYATKGGYATSLRVTDAQGKTAISHYNAIVGNDPSALAANFSFPPAIQAPGRLSKAFIQYTDASGTTFSSNNRLQPSTSSLEVLSVEGFVKNENNQPVKKVKLKFNCTLYNGAQSVSLQGTEVTVGFAYK